MKVIVRKPTAEEVKTAKAWPIWEKETSTFPWSYDEQETCLILEGKVQVKTPEGNVEFGEGDWVVFPVGLKCTWNIKEKVKKHYNFG
jgi:uncharacterized protein